MPGLALNLEPVWFAALPDKTGLLPKHIVARDAGVTAVDQGDEVMALDLRGLQ